MAAPTHRRLREEMAVYRIGDPKGAYPIYSAEGAKRVKGRWHTVGQEVIYTSRCYSTALLERLVHYSGHMPTGQCFIRIAIPAGTTYEVVTAASLPGWDERDGTVARAFGVRWLGESRSAILVVPSVVARIENEDNVLINPAHADAALIKVGLETPVAWDARLFK